MCQEDRHSDVQHSVGRGPEQNIQRSVSVPVRMREGTPVYPRGGEVPGDMVLRRSRVHRSSKQNIKGLDGGRYIRQAGPSRGWAGASEASGPGLEVLQAAPGEAVPQKVVIPSRKQSSNQGPHSTHTPYNCEFPRRVMGPHTW